MGKYSISVKGDKELRALLGRGALPLDQQETILRASAQRVAAKARARAPGTLASAISVDVERVGGSLLNLTSTPKVRAAVRVADRTRRGFRYAWALDASKKIRYRDRKTRKLTRNWFRGAKRGESRLVRDQYDRAVRAHLGQG